MVEEAVVLAGGRGQRLRPYTDHLPKPMLNVAGKPVMEYVVANLKRNGVKKAYFAVGYKGELIEEYFGNGERFGIEIEYFYEKELKNTAGALLSFREKLKENFFVVAGDHITTWNLRKMAEVHKEKKAIVTIGLLPKPIVLDYGVARVEDGYIKEFKEKPVETFLINTAVYVMNKEIFEFVEEGKDLSKDVFPELLKKNKKIAAFIDNEFWVDIGRVKDYERMNELLSGVAIYEKLF